MTKQIGTTPNAQDVNLKSFVKMAFLNVTDAQESFRIQTKGNLFNSIWHKLYALHLKRENI